MRLIKMVQIKLEATHNFKINNKITLNYFIYVILPRFIIRDILSNLSCHTFTCWIGSLCHLIQKHLLKMFASVDVFKNNFPQSFNLKSDMHKALS